MKIEELNKKHDRAAFDCGSNCLNTYLQNTARQHSSGGGSKTFVLVDEKKPTEIIGYFTMTMCTVDLTHFPPEWAKRYSKGPPPYALLLARLAVATKFKKNGYGPAMLIESMKRTMVVTDMVGGWGLFVDAKDKNAADFYKHHGFLELSADSDSLFIAIDTIKGLKLA